ncbi:unnamed protein product [Albugo candida]|uniref:Expansin-like EG45 domain-containing protein n=1 Tax=Albugo candida TaxID=65357 RepID=A0A024G916_9STRA|nr:unnamed protein product [Albugo candida]|eukprot:CCI43351.1 unnamed protein product [Albugo candida]
MRLISLVFLLQFTTFTSSFEIEATVYGTPHEINDGACGQMEPNPFVPYTFAISEYAYSSGAACGTCYAMTYEGTTITVMASDMCPECTFLHEDLTDKLWNTLIKDTPGVKEGIAFMKVDCPVPDTFKLCLKAGSNPNWLAVQAINLPGAVSGMKISDIIGKRMSTNNFFTVDAQNVDLKNVAVEVTGESGQVISVTVALQPGKCTAVNKQFSTSGPGGPSPSPSTPQIPPSPTSPSSSPPSSSVPPKKPCPPIETKADDGDQNVQHVTTKSGSSPSTTRKVAAPFSIICALGLVVGMTVYMKKRKNAKTLKNDVPPAPLQTVGGNGNYGQSFKTPNHHSDIAIL